MSDGYITIEAYCYSKKKGTSIGFGVEYDLDGDSISVIGEDWIYDGLADSFWENYLEFKSGVVEARSIVRKTVTKNEKNDYINALYSVFGDFEIECEANGEKVDLEFDINVNSIMYSMLLDVFVDDSL